MAEFKKYNFKDINRAVYKTLPGLSSKIIKQISLHKQEPAWMLVKRLAAYKIFKKLPLPKWGPNLASLNFDQITYYWDPANQQSSTWQEVPENIKNTFTKLGIPQAERKFLAGVGAQYESEMIYHNLKEQWTKLGVVFCDMSEAPKLYPELVKKYFGSLVPAADNKFAALNAACWSGGSFIYVPKGVKVEQPLQAYFRLNASQLGQFERTLIIVDEGASLHYIEGCTAPTYSKNSLHAAVVEVFALKNSKVRYTTIQNWSNNVLNLVTKRAAAEANAVVEWVDGNLGSKITMKYPAVILRGAGAKAEILTIALAGQGQQQDTGAKVIHLAPNTKSSIVAKSISKSGGVATYRGLVKIGPRAYGSQSKVKCDALILDEKSSSNTFPTINDATNQAVVEHEATVSKISAEQLAYLQSRGLTSAEAEKLIVSGFLQIFAKELPMEYALELNRLIALEMTGAVG
ncbi:MAG: Fe-S cluster assembly protein SufB [Candidatus Buchananbacteria bacterium]